MWKADDMPAGPRLEALYDAEERYTERPGERPVLNVRRKELTHIRRQGFAVNEGRSERPLRRPAAACRRR